MKKIKGQYPADLRTFALTLHFYSPRAYQYVRSLYQTNLPAPSTIRSWYSHTDVSPGFTQDAVQTLKLKQAILEKEKGKKLIACLMMDEMSIRQHVEWSHSKKKFLGLVDCGSALSGGEEDQPTKKIKNAKDALVYLLYGVNERWNLPVGYFLVNGLNSVERANLTREILEKLHPSGL